MNEQITFEQVPNTVDKIFKKLLQIEKILLKHNSAGHNPSEHDPLTVQQAADLLNLSKSTIYGKISSGEIPNQI